MGMDLYVGAYLVKYRNWFVRSKMIRLKISCHARSVPHSAQGAERCVALRCDIDYIPGMKGLVDGYFMHFSFPYNIQTREKDI